MTVNVSKPAINVREKLAELDKPTGVAGEAMLRAETPQEQQALVGISGRRNLIYNGAMQIAQRGTSATGITASGYRTCDRWLFGPTSGTYTVTQESSGVAGFRNTFKVETTTTGSSSNVTIQQRFEGYDLQSLGFGTSYAKPLTLSFWVRSNVTGTYTFELYNNDSLRQVSKNYTVDASGVWEHKVIHLPADLNNGFGNDNNLSLYAFWWLAAPSTFTSGVQNTSAWVSAINANRVSPSIVDISDTVGNYFEITGVQLELSKVATPFEHRSYGEELALCQRYFYRLERAATGANTFITGVVTPSSGIFYIQFPNHMRASPTVTKTGTQYSMYSTQSGVQTSISNFGITYGPFGTLGGRFLTAKVGDAGNGAWIDLNNDDTYFSFDAEL